MLLFLRSIDQTVKQLTLAWSAQL